MSKHSVAPKAVPAATAVPPREAPGERRTLAGWVYLLPSVAIFAIFVIYPFARTIITSFFATTPAATTGRVSRPEK